MPTKITDINEKKAIELQNKLFKISNRLDIIISDIVTTENTSSAYWAKVKSDIRKEYEGLRVVSKEWVQIEMPKIYREAIRGELFKIKNKKINPKITTGYKSFANKNSTKQSLAAIMADSLSSFATGFLSGQNTLIKLASVTQQINVKEKQIEEQIAKGFIETGSIRGSIKNTQKILAKKAIDGKYISIVNKNGIEEKWKVDTYAKLIARTKLQELAAQSVINTASEVGADLVQFSAHNTNCAICAPLEGIIYSLSGNNGNFPPLSESPPLHPNCMHTISVVFEEALKIDGTYDDYVKFSNGETNIHPTRKSFIPVSDRNLD